MSKLQSLDDDENLTPEQQAERMRTLCLERRIWEKSTEARTPEGKKRSSKKCVEAWPPYHRTTKEKCASVARVEKSFADRM